MDEEAAEARLRDGFKNLETLAARREELGREQAVLFDELDHLSKSWRRSRVKRSRSSAGTRQRVRDGRRAAGRSQRTTYLLVALGFILLASITFSSKTYWTYHASFARRRTASPSPWPSRAPTPSTNAAAAEVRRLLVLQRRRRYRNAIAKDDEHRSVRRTRKAIDKQDEYEDDEDQYEHPAGQPDNTTRAIVVWSGGVPKSGTTFFGIFIARLLHRCCEYGRYACAASHSFDVIGNLRDRDVFFRFTREDTTTIDIAYSASRGKHAITQGAANELLPFEVFKHPGGAAALSRTDPEGHIRRILMAKLRDDHGKLCVKRYLTPVKISRSTFRSQRPL